MTIPSERTNAVNRVAMEIQELFPLLHGKSKNVLVPRDTIRRLFRLLRHYPTSYELEITAEKCPELWGNK